MGSSHTKPKRLQRLRWYCQICQKQCGDENGFSLRPEGVSSETYLRQMIVLGENAGRHITDFSAQLQNEFITLLFRRCVHYHDIRHIL